MKIINLINYLINYVHVYVLKLLHKYLLFFCDAPF